MATGGEGQTSTVQGHSLLGEKFTCLICGQEDLTEEEMRSHVLLQHVECNICCPFCDLSGITGDEMNVHINAVHFDDLMSPIEKSQENKSDGKEKEKEKEENENEKDIDYTGREDADRFGLEHGGAIPKTKCSLKHSHSLDQGSPSHRSPKKTSGLKTSQSETSISWRGKLQLNFPSVNVPGPPTSPQSTIRTSASSQTIRGSSSTHSFRSSSSSQSIRASNSLDAFQNVGNNNESPSIGGVTLRGRVQNGNYNQSDIILEEIPSQDNNNIALQPNFNQIPTPDINDNIEPDINSNMPAGFSCPLCQFITSSENLIQTHVNQIHVDVLSPAKPQSTGLGSNSGRSTGKIAAETSCSTENGVNSIADEYPCPICMRIFDNCGELSLHVNAVHSNIFSPDKNAPSFIKGSPMDTNEASSTGLVCPVCEMMFSDRYRLEAHVNGHFSAEQTPVQEKTDKLIAQVLQEKEKDIIKSQEQLEFHKLQELYGMKEGTPYKKQYEKNLEKAVASGDMTVVEYHERKNGFKQADSRGVDDGSSCTKGVIQRLQEYYKTPTHGVSRSWLCTSIDHHAGSYGDRGWGCGYRNFQMLLSSLMSDPLYCKILFNGKTLMPSIPKIQRLIETAWDKGFDKQGCDQLGGKVLNTVKWIGATEIVATLSSLKVKCRLLDFHNPSGPNGTHTKLFDWVKCYFEKPAAFKPPLYLQHQGHSRTIVGIEELKDKRLRLLIFDPSTPKKQMQLFHSIVNANIMRTLRRTLEGLKAKQYQIVAVTGIMTDQQYEEHKVLKSERLS